MNFSRLILCLFLSTAIGSLLPTPLHAQYEDDEFRQGLIARYRDDQATEIVRVDRQLAFAWGQQPPDARLAAGPFEAQWRGFLMSQATGTYRLYVYAAGHVTIRLNDQVLLDAGSPQPAWLVAEPVELSFDWHELEVDYRRTSETARLAFYWSGPQFQLEPVGERQLVHEPEETPEETFAHGQQLVRALRCAACHEGLADREPMQAPSLKHVAGSMHRSWLIDWLQDDGKAAAHVRQDDRARRMPYFGFSADDAAALADYLVDQSETPAAEKTGLPKADARRGEQLFLSIGCLACHELSNMGRSGPFGGGDLSRIAAKRPKEFFARWLTEPASLNEHHRMPIFDLENQEVADLAAFLAEQGNDEKPVAADRSAGRADLIARGKNLFEQHRCGACHADKAPAADIALPAKADEQSWRTSCLADADAARSHPGYHLTNADAEAVRSFVTQVHSREEVAARKLDGSGLLRERNCLACHARGDAEGLAKLLPDVTANFPDLAAEVPAMTPPPLISVGDKLHDQALRDSILRRSGVRRDWLSVRMPKFRLSDDEIGAIVRHLVETDRIPEPIPAEEQLPETELETSVLEVAGSRLVTPDGFGCTSCHQVGKTRPPKAPLNARGPDLSQLGQRIRRRWFDRWVRNPARIIPRMEMPSVQLPVHGVLQDQLNDQLAAVWHVLNQPDFQPPEPDPVRVLRLSGISERQERTVAVTDVLRAGKTTYLKPLLIGLPNRHNVLVDLERPGLVGWWLGDVARQRTEGKTWYWEVAGNELLTVAPASDVLWQPAGTGQLLAPEVTGQFPTELDWFEHTKDGLSFQYRLWFRPPSGNRRMLTISQTFTAVHGTSGTPAGFKRQLEIHGLDTGDVVQTQLVDSDQMTQWKLIDDGRGAVSTGEVPRRIELAAIGNARIAADGSVQWKARAGRVAAELLYASDLPVDQFPLTTPAFPAPEPLSLKVVPGFDTVRLPLSDELMPTALAWRSDGSVLVCSLKGRVWLARDTDGDELEDQLVPFSDELAAPFGVAADGDYVDVVNKYALLRMWDHDGDGKVDRTATIASGWGHTTDYHDWAIGLPRDEDGNYYMALPCQQDKRSLAAAQLRGEALKLVPRRPTADDPRLFRIQPISAGHRFPIGIARNRDGALFVTDNQGNYNPFNELNHVQFGAHYGFINAIDRDGSSRPPLTPPAVDIPHPWTRSVNGICFLQTPTDVRERTGEYIFGPFEGHLVGCEYDTRRLIRMSLQKVGDTYQGAAYPLSRYQPVDGNTLLGPLTCAVAPDGDLYVGCIRDSGWGGANNVGTLVRMRMQPEQLPAGIAEVRATATGFVIEFTRPVDPKRAGDVANYSISSYTRTSTPAYGGEDQQRRTERIEKLQVSEDGQRAIVQLPEMREGFVYEIHLKNLGVPGEEFFPAEAYYTLRAIP